MLMMSDPTQSFLAGGTVAAPARPRNSIDSTLQRSRSGRVPLDRNGAMPMPMPVAAPPRPGTGSGPVEGTAMSGQMGMPRSPPKNKNTQHVPCKFFIYGQCQAGRTCPFSHDLESSTRPAPCKYFAKGSCKFGRKCALLHVTPDGTVVNRPQGYPSGPSPYAGPSGAFPSQAGPPGLLAQGLERRLNGEVPLEHDSYLHLPRNGYDMASMDMNYASLSPQFGSPTQESRFGGSPPAKGLSVLDAPLPSSFDSNGISMAARNGPFAASVPSRFGVESPPSSLPRKAQMGNTALRDLHSSAFGDRGMDGVLAGSSPPSGPDEPLTFPKRSLHSERFASRQLISASLGTRLPTQSFDYSDDEEEEEGDAEREGDLLPASLHDLIPEGRIRRESRSRTDDDSTPAGFLAAQRRTLSSHGTPQDSKVGSPHSSSPSRYSGVFMRRTENEGSSHVGSPLRNYGLAFAPSSSFPRTSSSANIKGDMSPTISSPPRQASMSMLTQELQRTKLSHSAAQSQAAAAAVTGAAASAATAAPQRTVSSSASTPGRSSLDRALSSQSVGRERIDEEQELFDMDEFAAAEQHHGKATAVPRSAGNGISNGGLAWGIRRLGSSPGTAEPTFGAIGGHRVAK